MANFKLSYASSPLLKTPTAICRHPGQLATHSNRGNPFLPNRAFSTNPFNASSMRLSNTLLTIALASLFHDNTDLPLESVDSAIEPTELQSNISEEETSIDKVEKNHKKYTHSTQLDTTKLLENPDSEVEKILTLMKEYHQILQELKTESGSIQSKTLAETRQSFQKLRLNIIKLLHKLATSYQLPEIYTKLATSDKNTVVGLFTAAETDPTLKNILEALLNQLAYDTNNSNANTHNQAHQVIENLKRIGFNIQLIHPYTEQSDSETITFTCGTEIKGLVVECNNHVYITFPGTQNFSDAKVSLKAFSVCWMLNFLQTSKETPAKIYKQFYERSIKPAVIEALDKTLTDIQKSDKKVHIHLSGHSLGGVLAILAGIDEHTHTDLIKQAYGLEIVKSVTTFSAPDISCQDPSEKTIVSENIYNKRDIVPKLSPSLLRSAQALRWLVPDLIPRHKLTIPLMCLPNEARGILGLHTYSIDPSTFLPTLGIQTTSRETHLKL